MTTLDTSNSTNLDTNCGVSETQLQSRVSAKYFDGKNDSIWSKDKLPKRMMVSFGKVKLNV